MAAPGYTPYSPSKSTDILVSFINEGQNPLIVRDVYAKVKSLLTTEEHVVNIFIQHKLIGLNASVIVTNWRIFFHRPIIVGGAHIEGHLWRLLGHPHLSEGPIYSTFSIETRFEPVHKMVMGFLPKLQALRLFSLAKEQADWWDEEHRLRNLELQRAASGGLILKGGLAGMAEQPHPVVPIPHTPFPFHPPSPPWTSPAPPHPGGPAMQPQQAEEPALPPKPVQETPPQAELPPPSPPTSHPPHAAPEHGHGESHGHGEDHDHDEGHGHGHGDHPPSPVEILSPDDPIVKLKELKRMLDNGLISKEEYQQKRQEILNEI